MRAIVCGRVAPKEVHEHNAAMLHCEGSLKCIDLVDAVDTAANACARETRSHSKARRERN